MGKEKMAIINNQKYILLNESLRAIKDGDINILTLVGSPGMGKTYTTLKNLKEQGINYKYINSYATPLSFYELLWKNCSKDAVVFDDLYGINNPLIMSMLKSACWTSDGKRVVSYYSTSSKMDLHDLPESFEFTPKIILIFNKLIPGYEPITNRGLNINFNFNFNDKMKIFDELKDSIDEDILDYVKINCNETTTNLSIRTLVILSNLKNSGKDFTLFAKEMLKPDEDKQLLISLTSKEWSDTTGMHRATYFRKKNKMKVA